ncbi:adenine deaminase C-terminal domain-containing protein [Caldalkalibacillus salinus]|uniref:adenine deaminase C-terminal domain-containing protein n=1 Tax=Caldalkalibacillus salinus TaxID=2803787 RepID=UPI0019216785|nr:adenine deaminase C-terminal domain-containing protein [Caldalkalibacillus salinus]
MSIRPQTLEQYQSFMLIAQRKKSPSQWLKGVNVLNVYTGQVETVHIHIAGDRIAYVGEKEPVVGPETKVIELQPHQVIVPGYIEPHAHPFQWYNPFTWGDYVLKQGTTTSINDNMSLFKHLTDDQALQFIERLDAEGDHLWLWWSRFDAQTAFDEKSRTRFAPSSLQRWLSHRLVIQGGEFTSWPLFLEGDVQLQEAMLLTRQTYQKRVEGHLPGASAETLNALTAAGIGADHESLNGEDVVKRLRLGLYATLRYSSIRPDLPELLKDIRQHPELNTNRLMLTNDGSMPYFLEGSGCDNMIRMVLNEGFEPAEAYRMATLNPATYYGIDLLLGGIAPGRLAHLNVLESLDEPTPTHVMVDGKWVIQDKKRRTLAATPQWIKDRFSPLQQNINCEVSWLEHICGDIGVELVNEVITRPYTYTPDNELSEDECYLSLLTNDGRYILNTRIKGFARHLEALASTFTVTKDYILIGRDKEKMISVLKRTIEEGGGIRALFEDGNEQVIPLPLAGGMSPEPVETLITMSQDFIEKLQHEGHPFNDPIYTLLFLTATHLPFIRLTEQGLYAIKDKEWLMSSLRL